MTDSLTCWQCGMQLENLILPMSRREECRHCNADQHVCMLCMHLNEKGFCTEDRAEHQKDLALANFCDYFHPTNKSLPSYNFQKKEQAKADLAALFNDNAHINKRSEYATKQDKAQDENELTPAQIAEQKLREMLGD